MPCASKLKRAIAEVERDHGMMESWTRMLAVDIVGSGQILAMF